MLSPSVCFKFQVSSAWLLVARSNICPSLGIKVMAMDVSGLYQPGWWMCWGDVPPLAENALWMHMHVRSDDKRWLPNEMRLVHPHLRNRLWLLSQHDYKPIYLHCLIEPPTDWMTVCSALLVACFVTQGIAGGGSLDMLCWATPTSYSKWQESMLSGDSPFISLCFQHYWALSITAFCFFFTNHAIGCCRVTPVILLVHWSTKGFAPYSWCIFPAHDILDSGVGVLVPHCIRVPGWASRRIARPYIPNPLCSHYVAILIETNHTREHLS